MTAFESSDGRLTLDDDGTWKCYSRNLKSWTTGALDKHDLLELEEVLPTILQYRSTIYDDDRIEAH